MGSFLGWGGSRWGGHPRLQCFALLSLLCSARGLEKARQQLQEELRQVSGQLLEERKKRETHEALARRLQKRVLLLTKVIYALTFDQSCRELRASAHLVSEISLWRQECCSWVSAAGSRLALWPWVARRVLGVPECSALVLPVGLPGPAVCPTLFSFPSISVSTPAWC